MLYRFCFVCLFVLASVKLKKTEALELKFEVNVIKKNNTLFCDHNRNDIRKYTVLEGKKVTLKIKHPVFINYVSCFDNNNETNVFLPNPSSNRNVTEFQIRKYMGNVWKCNILSHMYIKNIYPPVMYRGIKYAAAYCYMQIHVRQTHAPQAILVNNMVLKLDRTDLSEKNYDFTALYEYGAGDMVSVTCTNIHGIQLNLEYKYADQLSDIFNTSKLSSDFGVGFRAKLHSGHNNTEMICIHKEPNDYTKVMVKFIMQTKFDQFVRVTINGMILRPKPKPRFKKKDHTYEIVYKYFSNQQFVLLCEVVNNNTKLVIFGNDLIEDKKRIVKSRVNDTGAELTFKSNADFDFKCSADFKKEKYSAEIITFKFTIDNRFNDPCSLSMDVPSNGTVMELYENNKLTVVYYEFEEGETLTLNCRGVCTNIPTYLQLDGKTNMNEQNTNDISKTLRLKENDVVTCKLIDPKSDSPDISEFRVIFRERVQTTTIAVPTATMPPIPISPATVKDMNGGPTTEKDKGSIPIVLIAAIGGATCIVVICVVTIIFKLRKQKHSQIGPYDRNYENLQNETSISQHPVQWDQTYATPVDRRDENATYSVPYKPEADLYSIPVPKHERKKKNNVEPNYAILEAKTSDGRKNVFKDTNDPNYSEVIINKNDQCYAQVVPKSKRNQQDNNPYSYVTNDRTYENTGGAEPMYCEPNTELKSHNAGYVNVFHNPHYANSSSQEYVEPTYCELNNQK